jgi:spectinomycin phosphotransferase/16S rRNA (guanine(1405)-N(7))-methyltransferase
VFTKPEDLDAETIAVALATRWKFTAIELVYQPVGFGSHHWRAVTRTGDARFLSVDDLRSNEVSTPSGTTSAAFARLRRALRAARALREEAALDFVVAPLADVDGDVLARLDERYSLAVYPYLTGASAGDHGEYRSAADRAAVLDRVVALHAASEVAVPHAGVEDGFLPGRRELVMALGRVDETWATGPYGEQARVLLREHADGVRQLLAHFDRLAVDVCADRERMVITHGEPHAANVVVDSNGPRLVDWESALIAPPERDLCVLDPGDGSALAAYSEATGVALVEERLDYYRLWYDLFEIAGYIDLFCDHHADTADAAESWKNLVDFLQPARRWPALFR